MFIVSRLGKERDARQGLHLEEGYVPSTTYLYIKDKQVMGMISIRHSLNTYLRKVGGHIGYSVHPQHRRQGYATFMLQEAIAICRQQNIMPILITCDKDNIASAKTIIKCGGIVENETDMETILRFWIGE